MIPFETAEDAKNYMQANRIGWAGVLIGAFRVELTQRFIAAGSELEWMVLYR